MDEELEALRQRLSERYARCLFGDLERGNSQPSMRVRYHLVGISFTCSESQSHLRLGIENKLTQLLSAARRPRHVVGEMSIIPKENHLLVTVQFNTL